MLKLTLALLAVSCFGQDMGIFRLRADNCQSIPPGKDGWTSAICITKSLSGTVNLPDGPRVAIDVVNIRTMAQLGIPVPPTTTDHIRVTVTNLDPATVKVVISLTYFEDGEEVRVERTVTRGEGGARLIWWVKDASKITSASVDPVQELGVIQ